MSFSNPFDPPEDGLPPGEIRFRELRIEPWPDNRRVRVHITLTPFRQPPNLEASISDQNGKVISTTHIVEAATSRLVFTMHLRSAEIGGIYTLAATLSYPELAAVDQQKVSFDLQEPPAAES